MQSTIVEADAITDEAVASIVRELRAAERKSSWDRVREVGKIVLDRIVNGDEVAWRLRHRERSLSLRRLVAHPDCPFKKTALGNAVNVLLFEKRHAASTWLTSLTPTHVSQVLHLPEKVALNLLQDCASAGWSIRQLKQNVRSLRKSSGDRRGRPPLPTEQKAETSLRRALVELRTTRDRLAVTQRGDEVALLRVRGLFDEAELLVSEARNLAQSSSSSNRRTVFASAPHPQLAARGAGGRTA